MIWPNDKRFSGAQLLGYHSGYHRITRYWHDPIRSHHHYPKLPKLPIKVFYVMLGNFIHLNPWLSFLCGILLYAASMKNLLVIPLVDITWYIFISSQKKWLKLRFILNLMIIRSICRDVCFIIRICFCFGYSLLSWCIKKLIYTGCQY